MAGGEAFAGRVVWRGGSLIMRPTSATQAPTSSPNPGSLVPMIHRTADRAKDAIRFAHGRAVVRQASTAMRNYAKRLLSKQVARDVERITEFLCDMVRRGVPPHLAKRCLELIAFAIDEVAPRTSQPTHWDSMTIPELHRQETEAQWKREAAESSFMHTPSPATAAAFLNADDEYELARAAMRRRAVRMAAA